MATITLTFADGTTATATVGTFKIDELDILAPGNVAATAQMHVKQLGKDYQVLAGKFFTYIQNNLTTASSGSALDAIQGTELKRLVDFNKRATRILFQYDDFLTVTSVDSVLSVVFPAGAIAIPDLPAHDVSTATVSNIPIGGGIKLSFNTSTNAFTYSVVADLSAYIEGVVPPSNTYEFIIARNIAGKLETNFSSLKFYISCKIGTIVNANLVDYVWTLSHGMGTTLVELIVYDNNGVLVNLNDILTVVDANTITVNFNNDLTGTWTYIFKYYIL
jgi:hypothetical protein